MRSTRHIFKALATASGLALPAMPTGAQAGLFDEIGRLFGPSPDSRPVQRPFEPLASGREPLRFRVTPRLKRPDRNTAVRRSSHAAATSKRNLAVPINPETDPSWYLHDPTLRLGDVVVLPGEVLVFQGGRLPYSRDDFAALGASRLSAVEKQKLRAVTGLKEDRPIAAAKAQAVATGPGAGEAGSAELR